MASQTLSTGEHIRTASSDSRSKQELREANRNIHEFLDLLGHELRSPLAAIRNALHVLDLKGNDALLQERMRGMMDRQIQCITRLVQDMQDISLIEHGKMKLRKESLDLAQTVAHAVETVRPAVENRRHQLEVTLPSSPVVLEADPLRLQQVLTNLLNNASKYMEPGGCIWVNAELIGNEVVLRVRDRGLGIDPEMLAHIFDPFRQVERSLEYSAGGLGLGLALVRKLVEMHGGSVSASSAGMGCGSEFAVCLPVSFDGLGNVELHESRVAGVCGIDRNTIDLSNENEGT